MGEVDGGALVSAVTLHVHHEQELPADDRRGRLQDKHEDNTTKTWSWWRTGSYNNKLHLYVCL